MCDQNDPIKSAMKYFEIPGEYENFLFCLPGFYVAKSDGSISVKEVLSLSWNSLMSGLVAQRGPETKAFNAFAKNKLYQFQGKTNLADLDIATEAIAAKLAQFPDAEAQRLRGKIREICEKIAAASGPLFRDNVLPEESAMLERIFSQI